MPTFLFRFGNFVFPMEYIQEGGYDCTPNQRQDLDPYTDQYGVTQRNALAHTKTQIVITTRKGLTWNDVQTIMQGLTSNYTNTRERDAECSYFDTEYFRMSTGHFYLDPSLSTKINIFQKKFDSLKFTFIEY